MIKRLIRLPAKLEAIQEAVAFVEELLEEHRVPQNVIMQIAVAVDELFCNVASYSGAFNVILDLEVDPAKRCMRMCISDDGIPFDPLQKEDPDITLSAEERQIGGLGVFIVKQTMDQVSYAHVDGRNMLTIVKRWD